MEPRIIIKETSKEDLLNIMSLWNNDEVMSFVGYPQGLEITLPKLIDWLPWAISKPNRCLFNLSR